MNHQVIDGPFLPSHIGAIFSVKGQLFSTTNNCDLGSKIDAFSSNKPDLLFQNPTQHGTRGSDAYF